MKLASSERIGAPAYDAREVQPKARSIASRTRALRFSPNDPCPKGTRTRTLFRVPEGFLIVHDATPMVAAFDAAQIAAGLRGPLRDLRNELRFIDPTKYRGMSRAPLEPYLGPIIERHRRERGEDVSNLNARKRFAELVGADNGPLIPDLETSHELLSRLDKPDLWEIIGIAQGALDPTSNTLGFDLGWWGGEFYSLIADCAVAPAWHGPPLERLHEVAQHLSSLNEHVLFRGAADALEFLSYYEGQVWAETDNFVPVRIEEVLPA